MNNFKENNNRRSAESLQRRNSFLELLQRVKEIEQSENVGLQTAIDLGAIIKETNERLEDCELNDDVYHADATFIDSNILSTASGVLIRCVEAVDVNTTTYEPNEFANHICKFINEQHDFTLFESDASSLIGSLSDFYTLFGAFDHRDKPILKVKQKPKPKEAEQVIKKVPEKIVNAPREEESINDTVNNLYKVLVNEHAKNNNQAIDYFKYVIDTSCFSSTIENMFYSSFLVRNGNAKIDIDEDNNPKISPVGDETLKSYRADGGSSKQKIASITYADWKKFKFKSGFLQKYKNKSNLN